MPSWRIQINLASCFWFGDGSEKRRVAVSIVAGTLFSIGWWLMIDSAVLYPEATFIGSSILLGLLGTIAMIMVNSVSQQHINETAFYEGGCIQGNAAVCWTFVGFLAHCAVLFASFAVLCLPGRKDDHNIVTQEEKQRKLMAGVKIIMQNVLIFLSSMIYKFFRPEDDSVIY